MLMLKPRSAFIDVEGIRLHYLEWDPTLYRQTQTLTAIQASHRAQENDDNIPIVLLHGLGATSNTWNLVAEQLCKQHLVIAFDQRGHGQSDQPDSGYDPITMAEDIIRGMAALGLGQVVLAGHGWGARIALVLAARHPALFSHLVLVDCPHVEPRHWPGMTRDRFIRSYKDSYQSAGEFLQTMQEEIGGFWSPEIAEIVLSYIYQKADGSVAEHLNPGNQRQIRAAIWEDRALSYYGKLGCPVLLVPAAAAPQQGEEPPERLENADEFAFAKGIMAAQVARTIHNCTVLWMPDTAHDIQLQRPQRLAQAISQFIKE
jgi:pimeloyl-ACP methyl ester carboxylesterase